MTSITFVVHGVPAPQAGSRAVPTARGARLISTGGAGLQAWRNDVAAAAAVQAEEHGMLDGPMKVTVWFRFPMPKSRPKWKRATHGQWKTTAPDTDKLLRSLGDSLKAGGLIADDALIASWTACKVEVWEQWTGADITINTLEQPRAVA